MSFDYGGQRCPECSGEVVDAGEEMVCRSCGVVRCKEIIEAPQGGPLQAIDFTGQGLGGYLGSAEPTSEERRSAGLVSSHSSYSYLKVISDYGGREDSTFYSCAKMIERACDLLGLPRVVMGDAVVLAKKLYTSQPRVRAPTAAVSAFSIISAAKAVGQSPVGVRDILDVHRAIGRRVTVSDLIQLALSTSIKPSPRRAQDYLGRIAARLSCREEIGSRLKAKRVVEATYFTNLRRTAANILDSVDRTAMDGHHPCGLAATAMYSAEVELSRVGARRSFFSQKDAAGCAGIAEYTVRDQYRRIFKPALLQSRSSGGQSSVTLSR